jgi:hypothetical protein
MTPRGLTIERLREVLSYDPVSGKFTWKITLSNRCPAGQEAGTVRADGRRYIHIDGVSYVAAPLAWAISKGEFPVLEVDHKSRVTSDDRLKNLRLASDAQQQWNIGVRADNGSGFRGVHYCSATGRWRAQITSEGRRVSLGRFPAAKTRGEFHSTQRGAQAEGITVKALNVAAYILVALFVAAPLLIVVTGYPMDEPPLSVCGLQCE